MVIDSKRKNSSTSIAIRQASMADLTDLVKLERIVWHDTGVPIYSKDHFVAWLAVNPDCFLVAKYRGDIVGYSYHQRVNFSFSKMDKFVSCQQDTDYGYTIGTHVEGGNSFYGVSIVSIRAGVGQLLDNVMYRKGQKLGLDYYVGFPRLSGFAQYIDWLGSTGRLNFFTENLEDDLALWYAIKCVEMVGGKIWEVCPQVASLSLPEPKEWDRVFHWHLRNKEFGLAGVVSNYMSDLQSRNYAAFNVYAFK